MGPYATNLAHIHSSGFVRAPHLSPACPSATRKHSRHPITIGQSIVALNGPWKFHTGDDPQYASPAFDDSQWETVNLGPKGGSVDPNFGISGYVPGWTALGHPNYSGYAWYRIHIRLAPAVPNQPAPRLAIAGPANVDDAYQVYSNGTPIGSFGIFPAPGQQPIVYNSQPRMFFLPAEATGNPTAGQPGQTREPDQVLAFRLWMEPQTLTMGADAGGLHSPPLIGEARAVEAQYRLSWIDIVRAYAFAPLLAALFLLLGMLALTLILFDRSDPVYLWLAGVFLLVAISNINLCLGAWAQVESLATLQLTLLVFWSPLALGGWVMVWWVWFQLNRPPWIPRLLASLTLVYMLSQALGGDFFLIVPAPIAAVSHSVSIAVRLLFLGLLTLIVRWGIRQQGREGWLALPAVLLVGIAQFQTELQVLRIPIAWFFFGMQLSLAALANLVLLAAISALLLRRVLLSMRRQRQMALDVKQAQEVQRVLIPEDTPPVQGLLIESDYRPAREVGGDFFQIVPHPSDGSVLIVVGDVTGKGLQAGMLVALIVGVIRNQAETSFDPLQMLQSLNRRLCGRSRANATCLALHIAADGSVTLANAGHLAPWLNGKELAMEGALPIGMLPAAEFSLSRFHLAEDDTLFLMTDGVAEAQNPHNQLFGFARIEAMLQQPTSAAQLATAAQNFTHQPGQAPNPSHTQSDDILVLRVLRLSPTIRPSV